MFRRLFGQRQEEKTSRVRAALAGIVRGRKLRSPVLTSTPDALLIDSLASNPREVTALLEQVAQRLGMGAAWGLHVPESSLIERMGIETAQLQERFAIPQTSAVSPSGVALVAADPELISVEEFEAVGIQVLLGLGREISETWSRYAAAPQLLGLPSESPSHFMLPEQLLPVLGRVALDCARCGASEVFIGHPTPDRYEFLADERLYGGTLHRTVYDTLVATLKANGAAEMSVDRDGITTIRAALTRNFEHPVICLSWDVEQRENRGFAVAAPAVEDPGQSLTGTAASQAVATETVASQAVAAEAVIAMSPSAASAPAAIEVSGEALAEVQDVAAGASNDNPPLSGSHSVPEAHFSSPVAAPETLQQSSAPESVLIIDDDTRFSGILTRVLEKQGYSVTSTTDASGALAMLQQGTGAPFELIICDVHMPVMDGPAFLRQLRESGLLHPVIMLTSDEDQLLEAELVFRGANAYVRKNEDPRVLLAWAKNLMRKPLG